MLNLTQYECQFVSLVPMALTPFEPTVPVLDRQDCESLLKSKVAGILVEDGPTLLTTYSQHYEVNCQLDMILQIWGKIKTPPYAFTRDFCKFLWNRYFLILKAKKEGGKFQPL